MPDRRQNRPTRRRAQDQRLLLPIDPFALRLTRGPRAIFVRHPQIDLIVVTRVIAESTKRAKQERIVPIVRQAVTADRRRAKEGGLPRVAHLSGVQDLEGLR